YEIFTRLEFRRVLFRSLIQKIKDDYWRNQKSEQIKNIILACSGLYLEVVSSSEHVTKSAKFDLNFEATNRSNVKITLKEISFLRSEERRVGKECRCPW